MVIESLSEKPFQALCALATYRYLTARQFVDLGIAATPAVARDSVLHKLERHHAPLAKAYNLGRWIGYGQLPYIHYLTKRGATELTKYLKVPIDQIHYPTGGVQFSRDIFHRMGVIDCHIRLQQWAKRNHIVVSVADLYFDRQRKVKTAAARTRLYLDKHEFIEPDGVFGFKKGGQAIFFVLEYHYFPDTGRIIDQLMKHMEVLTLGIVAQKYNIQQPHFVLSVYNKEATMKRVQQGLLKLPEFRNFSKGFLFNTLERLKQDLRCRWEFADERKVYPFR